jgi:hypothetical protein
MFVILFSFGAGLYANTGEGANIAVKFLSWISPFHYSCILLLRRFWEGKEPEQFVDETLEVLGFTYEISMCVFALITFYFFYLLVGMGSVYRLAKL